jgi:hypothetical protein
VGVGDDALKDGLRAGSWFSFGAGFAAVILAMVFFRGVGKIGGKDSQTQMLEKKVRTEQ